MSGPLVRSPPGVVQKGKLMTKLTSQFFCPVASVIYSPQTVAQSVVDSLDKKDWLDRYEIYECILTHKK